MQPARQSLALQHASAAAPRLLFGPLGVEPGTHSRGEALLQEVLSKQVCCSAAVLFCSVTPSVGPAPRHLPRIVTAPYGFVAAVWLPTQRAHVLLPRPAEV